MVRSQTNPLRVRRTALVTALVALIASAAETSRAGTEVEAAASGGTSTGGWACGPLGRANYGGLNAQFHHDDADGPDESAVTFTAGGGADYEDVELVDARCDDDCSTDDTTIPPATVLFGAHARLGYRWESFGIAGGGVVYSGYKDNTDDSVTLQPLPQVEATFGRRDATQVRLGLGVPNATMSRRPGLYVGARFFTDQKHIIDISAGAHRMSPVLNQLGSRADGVWKIPVSETLLARLGVSAALGDGQRLGGEGSVGVSAMF